MIDSSYEQGRDDGAGHAWIDDTFSTAARSVDNFPVAIEYPSFMRVVRLDATSQIRIKCSAVARVLSLAGLEGAAGEICQKLGSLPCVQT